MASVSRLKVMQALAKRNRRATTGLIGRTAPSTFRDANPYWERDFRGHRSPMVVTSNHWLRQNRYIVLYVNPREIAWNLARRESVTKTAAGAIRNAWRNRFRGTYYDEPTMSLTFQTGNIMPGAGIPSHLFGQRTMQTVQGTDSQGRPVSRSRAVRRGENADAVANILKFPPVPPGIQNFYDFLELVDQPMLATDNTENQHILLYRTRVFPRMRIEGYFTGDPITFNESAGSGNKLEWNASFMVYRTLPKLWGRNASALLSMAYSDSLRSFGGMSEIIPNDFDMASFLKFWEKEKGEDLTDADLPYKTLKTDSGRNKKKVGLVTKTGAKTGTDGLVLSNEAQARENVFSAKQLINSYKAEGVQLGTKSDETLLQTEYWPYLDEAINKEFAEGIGGTQTPPPTEAEVNAFAAQWMKQNMSQADLGKYATLLHRLENP